MPSEPTGERPPLQPPTRETVLRMQAEFVGKTVPAADESAVVEMLGFLAEDLAALKAMDTGEIEPAMIYRFARLRTLVVENTPESCLGLAEAVRTHQRTARETVDAALAKAEQRQATYRAFITLAPELARRQAERVDQRIAAGEQLPLAGVPFAVKDLFDAAGLPTTCGSKAFAHRIAERDATVVRRLVDAGAVLLGKANMHECAFGFTGQNPHYGDCKNPVDPQRMAGGSSSGSAVAVVLGICPFAIGSDTGGSVRLPAALCGLVGLKPTYGRVSRAGGVPLAWSMDHVGPLTRSAADAAAVLQVIAGARSGGRYDQPATAG